ncbi:response regulator [Bradyrhizobium sp. 15]|uniref:response regulator n=1 Tax=Bradyrhizobium sp. 15 TaxID=2782633 RepID=UPI001FFA7ADA|nr:response regulator [Bradyrhizobium sp. 15]MCK1439884.1 response regulator [Bradyrhizobium sp. 15]
MHLSNSHNGAERSTILLVEDEALRREMLEETLIEAGYKVVSAASGEEAAHLLIRTPPPRAVVTDINLGRARMDGWGLARLARDPSCGILYVSADSAHRWASNGVPRSILLPKPFAPAQLVQTLSDLLIRTA